jgi:hypothetical protein
MSNPEPHVPWHQTAAGVWIPGHGLGAKPSKDRPFSRLVRPATLLQTATVVNRRLDINSDWIRKYDQGREGACVGFAWSWAMSILNRMFYAARKLYLEAQYRDIWGETPPEEGTSIDAGGIILVEQGHWRFTRGVMWPAGLMYGIKGVEVARNVDDVRYAISRGLPAVFGIPWYANFDAPIWTDPGAGGPRWWIGLKGAALGAIRGWHAICGFGARDDIEAVQFVNNWGYNYPIVNCPYATVEGLLETSGGALVPIDR